MRLKETQPLTGNSKLPSHLLESWLLSKTTVMSQNNTVFSVDAIVAVYVKRSIPFLSFGYDLKTATIIHAHIAKQDAIAPKQNLPL